MFGRLCFVVGLWGDLQVGCGLFRKQIEDEAKGLLHPSPHKKRKTIFCLYMKETVLIPPHIRLREKLSFAFALFFSARFGVGYTFFFTRPTWLYVAAAAVWMWRHVEFAIEFTRQQMIQCTAQYSRALAWPIQKATAHKTQPSHRLQAILTLNKQWRFQRRKHQPQTNPTPKNNPANKKTQHKQSTTKINP